MDHRKEDNINKTRSACKPNLGDTLSIVAAPGTLAPRFLDTDIRTEARHPLVLNRYR